MKRPLRFRDAVSGVMLLALALVCVSCASGRYTYGGRTPELSLPGGIEAARIESVDERESTSSRSVGGGLFGDTFYYGGDDRNTISYFNIFKNYVLERVEPLATPDHGRVLRLRVLTFRSYLKTPGVKSAPVLGLVTQDIQDTAGAELEVQVEVRDASGRLIFNKRHLALAERKLPPGTPPTPELDDELIASVLDKFGRDLTADAPLIGKSALP